MCKVENTWRIYVKGGLLVNLLVSLPWIAVEDVTAKAEIAWGETARKVDLDCALSSYKSTSGRGRLKLLVKDWSSTVGLDCMICYALKLLSRFLSGQLWGQVPICTRPTVLNISLRGFSSLHGYITKPYLICWRERACNAFFQFLPGGRRIVDLFLPNTYRTHGYKPQNN